MSLEEEWKHHDNLKKLQRSEVKKQAMNNYRDLKKIPKKNKLTKKITSVIGYAELTDLFLVIALIMAIMKDTLDFVGIGSLPLIGTAVTIVVSVLIGACMLITGTKKNRKSARNAVFKRWGALSTGTIFEFLFGINFLPIETLTVLVITYLTLKARQEADEDEQTETSQKPYTRRINIF